MRFSVQETLVTRTWSSGRVLWKGRKKGSVDEDEQFCRWKTPMERECWREVYSVSHCTVQASFICSFTLTHAQNYLDPSP